MWLSIMMVVCIKQHLSNIWMVEESVACKKACKIVTDCEAWSQGLQSLLVTKI